jgi:hypothetical protein
MREEAVRGNRYELEIHDMTTTLNTLAAGVIGAAALISGAHAGPIVPVDSSNEQAGAVATTVSTAESPNRIYCYSGVTGTPTSQARGWVCQRESVPEKR